MKILLTGCAGFIGSNFVKTIAVKNTDYEFVILDALTYAGHYETIKNEVDNNKHISFINMNLTDKNAIDELFLNHKFNGVINFAAETHVDNSIKNPNIFLETNIIGTCNLLNAILKFKLLDIRYLQVSTDEVYGSLSETDEKFSEKTPLNPSSPYSASKAAADLLVHSYYETYKLQTLITRCSNNYGPFQLPEKLIPLIVDKALRNEQLPVYGNGKNIRDWIYVDDHNEGVWAVFLKGKPGEVYNLGGNSEKRNIEVIKEILNLLGKDESLISYVEDRKGHDWRYAINYSKIERELNWSPKTSFAEGIKKTVNWYTKNTEWIEIVK